MEDILISLGKGKCWTSLDQTWGFYQIEIDPADRPKTAFSTSQGGHYEFKRLAMGLSMAPLTFQKAIDIILAGLSWNQVLAYLDDTLIIGTSFEDNLKILEQVFDRSREAGIKLRLTKCRGIGGGNTQEEIRKDEAEICSN